MPVPIRCHHIPVTSWRAMVVVIIGGTQDELVEAFRRYKLRADEQVDLAVYCATQMRWASAVHLQATSRPRRQFIYFPKTPDLRKPHHAATVVHEARIEAARRADAEFKATTFAPLET